MLSRLWHYISGYVIIKLEGMGLERLLNQYERKGLSLWNIKRTGRTRMTAHAPYPFLRSMEHTAEEFRCNLIVLEKKGLLPGLTRLFGRKLLAASLAVAIIAVVAFTRFVWMIEIDGKLDAQVDIAARLEEMDIRPGVLWNKVDTHELAKQLMLQNDNAAQILVNREGIKLIVEVIPVGEKPEYIEDETPCDIVATKDGVIVSVTALERDPLVGKGDSVKAGDILIKGEFLLEENQKTREVAARGSVIAKVWSTGVARVPVDEITRKETGKTFEIRTMYMGSWEIPIDELPDDFGDYIIEDEREQEISSLYVPAVVKTTRVKEVELQVAEREYTLAEEEGKKLAYKDALSRLPGEEGIENVSYTSTILPSGELEVRAFLETQEEIGEVQYH